MGVVVTALQGYGSAPKPQPPSSTAQKTAPSPDSTPKAVKPSKAAPKNVAVQPKPAKADKAAAPTVALTPLQEKLQKNTNLAATLTSRLPAGSDLMTASAGFRNLGQFVAVVNVSTNLGIPLTGLKTKMLANGMSLSQAIHALRPASSATIEAQHAEYDARSMIAESERQPQVTPATTPAAAPSKSKARAPKHTQ
jgi:hypothetical protein